MSKHQTALTCASVAAIVALPGCLGRQGAAPGPRPGGSAAAVGAAPLVAGALREELVRATLEPYSVESDLSNVANLGQHEQFRQLTNGQRQLLARNAFVVVPGTEEQLFIVYEENEYTRPKIPAFVTTDCVLQLYHIFYDYALRTVETEHLDPALTKLTDRLSAAALGHYRAATSEAAKTAAARNYAYLAVAKLLRGDDVDFKAPAEVSQMAMAELDLIRAHEGRARSPIFGYKLDYSQFVPRGHYTRTDQLRRFFTRMAWYGTVPFPYALKEKSRVPEETLKPAALQGAMLCALLGPEDGETYELWESIHEPTAFFVGVADDLTPREIRAVMKDVYGPPSTWSPDALADDAKLDRLIERVNAELPEPRITTKDWGAFGVPVGKQLRLMGQRFIPDSYILQNLVFDYVGTEEQPRELPRGLDVFAAFGSDRALRILLYTYDERRFANYNQQMRKLLAEFRDLPADTWTSNLYWSWLWVLRAIVEPKGEGYPSFMTNEAWRDRALNTALASWAELRHDTVLFGKQSGVAEAGDVEPPEPPKGYVEPDVTAYRRLRELTRESREGLSVRGFLGDPLRAKFEDVEKLLGFLQEVSEKELRGQSLTADEYHTIEYIGGELEHMTLSVHQTDDQRYSVTREADRNMACIADVASGVRDVLEEAVGPANLIYVVCPIEGKLRLTRGAAFSYFEFRQPIGDRLTDEQWQQMLKEGKAPEPPIWTESFLSMDRTPEERERDLALTELRGP